MSINISYLAGAGAQFFDSNGDPLAGGLLYTYNAGTTTPVSTYTSRLGVAFNTNPIVLDAAGRTPAEIWLNGGSLYKFVLKDSTFVQIGSYDNIPAVNDPTTNNNLITVAGTNALAGLATPTLEEYTAGAQYSFIAQNTNTGAVTINIDGLGVKSITKAGAVSLEAGDIVAGAAYIVLYDGTRFQLMTRTSASQLVVGTTAQRPSPATTGMIRQNSTTGNPEWYDTTTSSWLNFSQPAGYSVNYLVVAGGGGGGFSAQGGGGGAGGLLFSNTTLLSGTAYTITVGSGGAGATSAAGSNGSNSVISSVATALGGGGGAATAGIAGSGGSGGGGAYLTYQSGASGTSGQGFAGGNGFNGAYAVGGGGGGASAVGANGNGTSGAGGAGGTGTSNSISGSAVTYAGGGGGSSNLGGAGGAGGAGGGGAGSSTAANATAGTANTGGGGGGAALSPSIGGNGGSGIVIISYLGSQRGTGGTVTSSGGYTIHTFTSSSTYNA